MSAREMLLGSAFHFTSGDENGGAGFAAWGRVTTGGFDAKEEDAQARSTWMERSRPGSSVRTLRGSVGLPALRCR